MSSDLKARIIQQVGPDLEMVEKALEENLAPNLELVREIASHLLFSGGKRLRPLLAIHAARMCGHRDGFEVLFSTIFEYLHAATLLHDDVVDGAEVRRGKAAAHTRWGAPKVVLTGDFLLARALDIAARTESPRVISVIANITREMSQGEIDQMAQKGRLDLSEREYMEIIRRKTAVLIQGACRTGAIVAGASEATENALDEFGYHLGMAFQMADDLLDYTATVAELGKNPGADLREGKLTLPLIYGLTRADAKDRAWMEALIRDPLIRDPLIRDPLIRDSEFDTDQFEKLRQTLETLDGITYTREKAKFHVKTAKERLGGFPESQSKSLLNMIADYSIQRKV